MEFTANQLAKLEDILWEYMIFRPSDCEAADLLDLIMENK